MVWAATSQLAGLTREAIAAAWYSAVSWKRVTLGDHEGSGDHALQRAAGELDFGALPALRTE